MSKKRKQQLWLALLATVLLLVVWRQAGPDLSSRFSAGRGVDSASRAGTDTGGTAPLPEVVDLRLEDLEAVSGELNAGRNPFQVESAPPPSPQPSAAGLREALARRAAAQPEPPVRTEPTRPTPPPVDVVFLGSFGPDSGKLAVFTDGREIYNVGQGQVLKDKFVVVRIGFESADLGFVGFPATPARRLEIGG